jgi:hypothetical protein
MENAIWLLLALPSWFLGAATDPLGSGALTLIPAIGTASLLVGVVLGFMRRSRVLLWFVCPFLLSEGLVALSGLMRGELPYSGTAELLTVMLLFAAAQLISCGFVIYRTQENRVAAVALSAFSMSYGAFAAFIAAMSFRDDWI